MNIIEQCTKSPRIEQWFPRQTIHVHLRRIEDRSPEFDQHKEKTFDHWKSLRTRISPLLIIFIVSSNIGWISSEKENESSSTEMKMIKARHGKMIHLTLSMSKDKKRERERERSTQTSSTTEKETIPYQYLSEIWSSVFDFFHLRSWCWTGQNFSIPHFPWEWEERWSSPSFCSFFCVRCICSPTLHLWSSRFKGEIFSIDTFGDRITCQSSQCLERTQWSTRWNWSLVVGSLTRSNQ